MIDRGDEASGLDLEEEGEGPVRNSADLQPIPRSRNIGVILAFHVQVGTFSTCALFPLSLARLSTGFVVRPHICSFSNHDVGRQSNCQKAFLAIALYSEQKIANLHMGWQDYKFKQR